MNILLTLMEINPSDAVTYLVRGIAYYEKKDYDKAWDDIHKAQSLGLQVRPNFLEALRKASAEKPRPATR